MDLGQRILPFLWFDHEAEKAARFYVDVFPNAELKDTMPGPDGNALVVEFILNGMQIVALNGGPMHKLTEAFSFVIRCKDQAEVDYYWSALSAGGQEIQCGWLKDKFGLCWQVVPDRFGELCGAGTPKQAEAVMGAMMQMVKFDIPALEEAFASASD